MRDAVPSIGQIYAAAEAEKLLHRAQTNLWWLATEILEFDKLTEDFHKPMMQDMDRARRSYYECIKRGVPKKNDLDLWARDHYKTTVLQVQMAQDYLCDPTWTNIIWHAVDDMAIETGIAVGRMFQENKALRALYPEIMPAASEKKWASASGFRFKACKDKAPSMRMAGAGSEVTGGHAKGGNIDDPIGLNDVTDSQMPAKRRWFGLTVRNVIRTDYGWIRGRGTRWDADDLFASWLRRTDWSCRVRAAYEIDGIPTERKNGGIPVLYTEAQLEAKRRNMSSYEWSCQMMNDPLPDTDRLWKQTECEHFIEEAEAMKGPGRIFVLSDPAPALVGSQSGVKEKERGDASKDWWAIAVVRLRVNGDRRELILLDGEGSQDWPTSIGFQRAMNQLRKWHTNMFFNEAYGGLAADFTNVILESSRIAGAHVYRDPDGRVPGFLDSYAASAKNNRIEMLADWAKQKRFLISKSCPEKFVHGDGEHTGVLTQLRKYRPTGKGKNNLRWDDFADVAARGTDSALQQFAPRPNERQPQTEDEYDEWAIPREERPSRSRYCAI